MPNALWEQVTLAVAGTPSGRKPVTLYYGHAHNAAAYSDIDGTDGTTIVRPRLCGHAAMPYTIATDLTGASLVTWMEKTYVSGSSGPIRNGFASLRLQGPAICERMFDKTGEVSWHLDSPS